MCPGVDRAPRALALGGPTGLQKDEPGGTPPAPIKIVAGFEHPYNRMDA